MRYRLIAVGALVSTSLLYMAAAPEVTGGRRGRGAYRDAEGPRGAPGEAPRITRLAAFSSLLLGQLVAPGAFGAGLSALAVMDDLQQGQLTPLPLLLAAASPTWLVSSAWVLAAGIALRRRAEGAAQRARRAGWTAMAHHALFLAALGVGAMVSEIDRSAVIALAALAQLSIMNGWLLVRAAGALATEQR